MKEYYQILVDTLLGTMVEPFKRRKNRQTISKASKFYLFDVGVAGVIIHREIHEEKGELFGKAFEHFILMQMVAHSSYSELEYDINFWRTKSGMEVDFILGKGEVAVEIKGSSRVDNRDLKSLSAFIEECSPRKGFVVCNEKAKRVHGNVILIPWRMFLDDLWEGKVI